MTGIHLTVYITSPAVTAVYPGVLMRRCAISSGAMLESESAFSRTYFSKAHFWVIVSLCIYQLVFYMSFYVDVHGVHIGEHI